MSFELVPAMVAGFAGTVAMSATMGTASSMGLTEMTPMHLVVGSMMSADRTVATRIGMTIHYGVIGTAVFGLGYAALLAVVGDASVTVGGLMGLIHGAVAGLVAMPTMPAMHRRMSIQPFATGISAVSGEDGQMTPAAPGLLANRWGAMTPVGLLVGHVAYGVVVALVYGWLV